jgi:hypothetical protein
LELLKKKRCKTRQIISPGVTKFFKSPSEKGRILKVFCDKSRVLLGRIVRKRAGST